MRKLYLALLLCLALGGLEAQGAARFAVCTTTCTWDGADTSMWSASSGGATGASVPGASDTVTLDGSTCVGGTTCTITVNTTVTVQSITMSACTASTSGCILDFSANNNNVTLSSTASFVSTGSGTRTLNMGNGTWTITATSGTPWNTNGATNQTLTRNSSTIVFNGTVPGSVTFAGNGYTYGAMNFSGTGGMTLTGANTFASWAQAAGTTVLFPSGTTTTIEAAPTLVGTASLPVAWVNSSLSAQATVSIASGTANFTWFAARSIAATGGATFSAASSCVNLGNNSGISPCTAPTSGGGRIIGG